jgi:hypothetical protein
VNLVVYNQHCLDSSLAASYLARDGYSTMTWAEASRLRQPSYVNKSTHLLKEFESPLLISSSVKLISYSHELSKLSRSISSLFANGDRLSQDLFNYLAPGTKDRAALEAAALVWLSERGSHVVPQIFVRDVLSKQAVTYDTILGVRVASVEAPIELEPLVLEHLDHLDPPFCPEAIITHFNYGSHTSASIRGEKLEKIAIDRLNACPRLFGVMLFDFPGDWQGMKNSWEDNARRNENHHEEGASKQS